MKVKIKYGDGVVSVPQSIYSFLPNLNANDAKVLFSLIKNPEPDIDKMAQELNMSESEISSSIGFWRGCGIIEVIEEEKKKTNKNKNAPEINSTMYTSADIEKIIGDTQELPIIIKKCESILEKTFSIQESRVIVYLYNHISFYFYHCQYYFLYFSKKSFY